MEVEGYLIENTRYFLFSGISVGEMRFCEEYVKGGCGDAVMASVVAGLGEVGLPREVLVERLLMRPEVRECIVVLKDLWSRVTLAEDSQPLDGMLRRVGRVVRAAEVKGEYDSALKGLEMESKLRGLIKERGSDGGVSLNFNMAEMGRGDLLRLVSDGIGRGEIAGYCVVDGEVVEVGATEAGGAGGEAAIVLEGERVVGQGLG